MLNALLVLNVVFSIYFLSSCSILSMSSIFSKKGLGHGHRKSVGQNKILSEVKNKPISQLPNIPKEYPNTNPTAGHSSHGHSKPKGTHQEGHLHDRFSNDLIPTKASLGSDKHHELPTKRHYGHEGKGSHKHGNAHLKETGAKLKDSVKAPPEDNNIGNDHLPETGDVVLHEHLKGSDQGLPEDGTGSDHMMSSSGDDSEFDQPVDENPNNWITHIDVLDPLPENVIVPLSFENNDYYGRLTVGTSEPGNKEQQLKVLFDTGSPDLWLLSPRVCEEGLCSEQARPFISSLSTTYTTNGEEFESQFASASVLSGSVGVDVIKLGLGDNKLVIRNQAFGEALDFEDMFEDHDAVMGLDLISPPLIRWHPDPPLYQMTRQFGTAPVFGFYLNKYFPHESKLVIGGGDGELIVGSFSSHPVKKVPYKDKGEFYNGWNIAVDRFEIEGRQERPVPLRVPEGTCAQPDTGTTTIVGPEKLMTKLNTIIFKLANYPDYNPDFSFPCAPDQVKTIFQVFPDVSIVFGETRYTFWPSDYIGASKDTCQSLFRGFDGYQQILLGRTFMLKYYTRFDHANKRVQIAEAKQGPHPDIDILKQIHDEAAELAQKYFPKFDHDSKRVQLVEMKHDPDNAVAVLNHLHEEALELAQKSMY